MEIFIKAQYTAFVSGICPDICCLFSSEMVLMVQIFALLLKNIYKLCGNLRLKKYSAKS